MQTAKTTKNYWPIGVALSGRTSSPRVRAMKRAEDLDSRNNEDDGDVNDDDGIGWLVMADDN